MNTRYLLDTNGLIAMLKDKNDVRKQILKVGFENCYVSEISIAELFYGAAKGGRKKNMEDVNHILRLFEILPIFPSLKMYGQVKAMLEMQGRRIDDFDLLIGATALQNKLTMVTANVKHLERIPNLIVENWMD